MLDKLRRYFKVLRLFCIYAFLIVVSLLAIAAKMLVVNFRKFRDDAKLILKGDSDGRGK